jgi:hypothetical protein
MATLVVQHGSSLRLVIGGVPELVARDMKVVMEEDPDLSLTLYLVCHTAAPDEEGLMEVDCVGEFQGEAECGVTEPDPRDEGPLVEAQIALPAGSASQRNCPSTQTPTRKVWPNVWFAWPTCGQ